MAVDTVVRLRPVVRTPPLRAKLRRATKEELCRQGIVLGLVASEQYSKVLRDGVRYEGACVVCYPNDREDDERYRGGYSCFYCIPMEDGQPRELDCRLFVPVYD